MGILARALRPITGPGIFWPQDYPSATTSVAGVDVTPAGAFGLPAFFAAVRAIAEDIAKLPFIVYEQLERGKRRAPEHPLYRVLHDVANPEMTAFVWRETSVGHLVTWGNCYSEIERNQQGEIVALWPIPPHLVKIKRHSSGERYYIIRAPVPDNSGNYDTVLEAKNMLHVPGLGYDGLIGYGPIDLLAKSIGVGLAAQDYASQSWANGSRPGGVLEVPSNLEMSDLALARLRQQYEAGHRGMSNAQRIAILQDGITFKEVGVTPEAAQFLETRQFQVSEVARGMRIPPHKIGDLSHATFTNIEQQALEYVNDGLAGWAGRLEAQARKDLFTRPQDKGFFGELLFDALLRGDSITRARVWSIYHMNGNVTPNYINERENFPIREDAGGDEYLRPLNMAISGDPGNPALGDNNIKQTIEAIPDTRPTNGRAPVEVPTA